MKVWGYFALSTLLAVGAHAQGTWITGEGYRFLSFSGAGDIQGKFRTTVVTNVPHPADVIVAPQSERLVIYGDCKSKTYQVWDLAFTDANGMFQQGTGPDQVAHRVLPDSQMENVFRETCVASLIKEEASLNEKCRSEGHGSPSCDAQDNVGREINTRGWYFWDGQWGLNAH